MTFIPARARRVLAILLVGGAATAGGESAMAADDAADEHRATNRPAVTQTAFERRAARAEAAHLASLRLPPS